MLTVQESESEKQSNENTAIQWMQENWKKSFLFSALDAAFIVGSWQLMNKGALFELRKPLVLLSPTLAVLGTFNALDCYLHGVHFDDQRPEAVIL